MLHVRGRSVSTHSEVGEDTLALYVAFIGLDETASKMASYGGSGVFSPSCLWHAPNAVRGSPFPELVHMFCFPDGVRVSAEPPEESFFTFCLTEADGGRMYGSAYVFHQVLEAPPSVTAKSVFAPYCLCVLSHIPAPHAWREILPRFKRINASQDIGPWLTKFLTTKIKGSQSCHIRLPHTLIRVQRPTLQLPFVTMGIPLHILFSCLGIERVIRAVHLLLLEQKVVIVSSSKAVSAAAVQLIVSLIRPFIWQHGFVPLLPRDLLDYTSSPAPFIMGMPSSYLSALLEIDTDDVSIVNMDSDEVHIPVSLHLPEIDEEFRQLLSDSLHRILHPDIVYFDRVDSPHTNHWRRYNHDEQIERDIRHAFRQFLAHLLDGTQECYTYLQRGSDPVVVFNKNQFIRNHSSKDASFYKIFVETQMFALFFEQSALDLIPENIVPSMPDSLCSSTSDGESDDQMVIEFDLVVPDASDSKPFPLNFELDVDDDDSPVVIRGRSLTMRTSNREEAFRMLQETLAKILYSESIGAMEPVIAALKEVSARAHFAEILLEAAEQETNRRLSETSFANLSFLVNLCLTAEFQHVTSEGDHSFKCLSMFVKACETYHCQTETGVHQFLQSNVREQEVWGLLDFWVHVFDQSVQSDSEVTADTVFSQLGILIYSMLMIGAPDHIIRTLVTAKATDHSLSDDQMNNLMQMIASMAAIAAASEEAAKPRAPPVPERRGRAQSKYGPTNRLSGSFASEKHREAGHSLQEWLGTRPHGHDLVEKRILVKSPSETKLETSQETSEETTKKKKNSRTRPLSMAVGSPRLASREVGTRLAAWLKKRPSTREMVTRRLINGHVVGVNPGESESTEQEIM